MLLKLLKYEFKSTWARFLSAFAVYAVMLAFLLLYLKNLNKDFEALTVFLLIACIFGLFIVTFITLFQRYNANLYGSEGYLMFTLPVSSKKLLLSKLISAFVWISLYAIVFFATIFCILTGYSTMPSIGIFFREVWRFRAQLPPYLATAAVGIVFATIAIYFSITVSKLPIWRGAGVIMGFITYFVVGAVQSFPMYSIGLWSISTENSVHSATIFFLTPEYQRFIRSLWISDAYTVLVCVALFFATAFLMKKHTSLK